MDPSWTRVVAARDGFLFSSSATTSLLREAVTLPTRAANRRDTMKKLPLISVAALLTTAFLTAASAHGQTVKCFKQDGIEEPCASRQLDMFPADEAFGSVTKTPLRAEYGGRIDQHIERWKALAESGDDANFLP